jgi:DNA-binding NtrC family response regulator
VTGISPDALAVLCDHDWPGNVRELRNAIVCGITHAVGDTIQPDDLKIGRDRPQNAAVDPPPTKTLLEHVFQAKRQFVIEAYKEVNGNATELAKRIPIDRKSLPRLLDSLGLSHLKQHNRGCRPRSSEPPAEISSMGRPDFTNRARSKNLSDSRH